MEENIFVIIAKAVYNELPAYLRNDIFLMDTNGFEVKLGPMDQKTFLIVAYCVTQSDNPESTGLEFYKDKQKPIVMGS